MSKETKQSQKEAREEARRKVSALRRNPDGPDDDIARGLLTSDWHFSHEAPVARSAEPDWYEAMARPVMQVINLAFDLKVPIFVAGDLLHKWNSPPQLINFIIDLLRGKKRPRTIPGQHDLPHHNHEDVQQSAYWTLMRARVITDVSSPPYFLFKGTAEKCFYVGGYGWKNKFVDLRDIGSSKHFYLGLFHRYVWSSKSDAFEGVRPDKHISEQNKVHKAFDAVAYGDNHKGFMYGPNVMNCGSLMCRHSDQKNYQPRVGILYASGQIRPYSLDVSEDKWLTSTEIKEELKRKPNFKKLIRDMGSLTDERPDFLTLLERYAATTQDLTEQQVHILRGFIESTLNAKHKQVR